MNINHVKINTYKSIKQKTECNILPVNILIGKNNCGKTNILNALQLAIDSRCDKTNLFYNKVDIEIDLEFTKEELKDLPFFSKTAKLVLQNRQRKLICSGKELVYDAKISNFLSLKLKRLDEYAFEDLKTIEKDFKTLFSYKKNLEDFKTALKKHFPKVSIDANAAEMDYDSSGLFDDDRKATIDWLGSGFRRVFTILLYIYHPQYSIVFIDEPETHLHPAMIKHLLWAMQNSNYGQILFTTHSPLFLNIATLPQVLRITKDNLGTKIFQLREVDYNYERLSQELNADNLEMFFADKVVLVEGASDKVLIRGLIDKFYKGDKEIKVIQIYGKGNAQIYIELLKTFQIPFIIIFDKDVLRGPRLYELLDYMKINISRSRSNEFFEKLKQNGVYIFQNGELEENYPKRYQKTNSKSINAFYASTLISDRDFDSKTMIYLKEIINNL